MILEGVGWLATVLTCAGLWRMGSKRRDGFLLGAYGNVAWILFATPDLMWSLITVNLIILALNVRGFLAWGQRGEQSDAENVGRIGTPVHDAG